MIDSMSELESCHALLRQIIGDEIEPIEVMRRAEEHRFHWRPKDVRVILLAESHVYTAKAELDRCLKISDDGFKIIPQGFVRLVYCPGYGENETLDLPIVNPKNSGTPQFWKVFFSCLNRVSANCDFVPILKGGETNLARRLGNKLRLLGELRAKGVWLLDASLAALYIPGRPKPAAEIIQAALRISWDSYLRTVICDARPAHVVCIGRGVGREMRRRLRDSTGVAVTILPQPNARLSAAEHLDAFHKYYEVCQGG